MMMGEDDLAISSGARRRQAIVEAALAVLAQGGLTGLTMQRVATQAALSKSVVLYYVQDRPGLLRLLAAQITLNRQQLEWALAQTAGDPPACHPDAPI